MSINQGHDDAEIRRQFGSDSARLVYGRDPECGKLVYIGRASRGLSCGLICPHCKVALVANLKDDLKAAHFAHHGPACGGGPETALHLLCKEIIQAELRLTIPRQFAAHGRYEVLIAEEREITFDRAILEFRDHVEVIPDLHLQGGDMNLFVEIAVTHPCEEQKISRLKRLGTAAVEIDMSSVPRNALPEEVRQAVLFAAPRNWLFNAKIERAVEEMHLRERLDANAAAKQLASIARRKIEAYGQTRRSAGEQKLRIKDLAALHALGVREHLALEIGGTGCFTVRSETWRSVVLATILRPRLYHHRFLATDHIVSRLAEEGYVHSDFVELTKDLADAMRHLDPEFLTPWEAIHRFLQALTRAGLIEQQHLSFALNTKLADRWRKWEGAHRKKTQRRNSISSVVSQILDRIPAEDRASMTVESWWQMTEMVNGRPREQTFDTDTSIDNDLKELLDVLLQRSSTSPRDLHGLPAARAIEAAISRKTETEAKANAKRAVEEADGRRQSMIRRAEQTLDVPDLADFLRTPLADQGGILPLDLAEGNFAGFGLAEEALSKFAQTRHAERVAAEWRSRLDSEARELFGDRAARIVRQSVDGKLDGRPPLIYCRDERTFRVALGVLHWIAQTV
ncbi:hypothetical protein [Mesorhizobium sp. M6A.T.Cr.TU.016.01.1.1]|uniref:hypothetical protein n=1 Tax=Mesorhizobium sp. M6A.T.Cr.TU.016.01.1.1 TaxID=2493677 RepID=UPI000F74D757|nr:hypothetical protein [Mesorhizobium sp. M6A.T.Cr.TU.016.01.1.1]AZO68024.1 hypothetical protein EJ075_26000 [Mesorhizobium sp. M6A.T.Cr.TU.016.01.1.1]